MVQVAGRIALHLPLTLHLCRRNKAPYLQGSLPAVRKEQCSESREPDSSPGSAPSAPYSELQLSCLSNGHGTRWSLSCYPELIMGILYEFQGGEWPQMHPLHTDGALFSGKLHLCCPASPAWFSQALVLFQGQRGEGRRRVKLCTPRLIEVILPKGTQWVPRNWIGVGFSLGPLGFPGKQV